MNDGSKALVFGAGLVGVAFGIVVIVSYLLVAGTPKENASPIDVLSYGLGKLAETSTDKTTSETTAEAGADEQAQPVDSGNVKPKPIPKSQVSKVETIKQERTTWTVSGVIDDHFDLAPGEKRIYTLTTEDAYTATLTGKASFLGLAFKAPLKISAGTANSQDLSRDGNNLSLPLFTGQTQQIVITNPRTDPVTVTINANIEYSSMDSVLEQTEMHSTSERLTP